MVRVNKLSLINGVLKDSRLGSVNSLSDTVFEVYPFNNLGHLSEESINVFSRSQLWNWTKTVTELEYFPSFTSYYLSDFDIDYNRVEEIFFFDGAEKATLTRHNYKEFRRLYGGLTDTGKPEVFCIDNDVLKFYPTPDQDYSLKAVHYKQLSPLIAHSDEIELIPERYQYPITDYVTALISLILDISNAQKQYEKAKTSLSKVKNVNQTFFNRVNVVPSRIPWS